MSITATAVKDLRERTGAGMMDCKKALTEVNGDFDAAVEFLKKQGLAKAVKKGDRVAAEGLVFAKNLGNAAVMIELNCETDFVSKNDDFLKLGADLANLIADKKPATLEDALKLNLGAVSVETAINDAISKIGEKISLRRLHVMTPKAGGKITSYSHSGGRIVVLLEITGDKATAETGKDLAMQIAAMSPQYVSKTDVPADVIAKEKVLQLEMIKESKDAGKPAEVLEKIITGKLDKFAAEMSLLDQLYVKDMGGKKKVGQYLKEVDPTATVPQFVRFAVGEGIEKRKDDFAEEVKKMVS